MNFTSLKSSRLVSILIGRRKITSQNFCQISNSLIMYLEKLLYKCYLLFLVHREFHEGYYIAFGHNVSLGSSACDSRTSLNWNLSNIFSMIILGLWVLERETTDFKCHFYYAISTQCITVSGDVYHLAEIVLCRFFTVKSFFPTFHNILFGTKSLISSPNLISDNYVPLSLRV